MTADNGDQDLGHPVRLALRRREDTRPVIRNLALIGALGWLIVMPTLAGTFLGRWLDHTLGSGITWTAALMLVGVVLGCRLAWNRIREE
ncbi:MAG: AtpZ/AtpI family protein [Alphaproteobacteria bacterium]